MDRVHSLRVPFSAVFFSKWIMVRGMNIIGVSYSFLNFCRINIFPLLLKLFLHGQFTKDITHLFILLSPRSSASLRHQFQSCSLLRHFLLGCCCERLRPRSMFNVLTFTIVLSFSGSNSVCVVYALFL